MRSAMCRVVAILGCLCAAARQELSASHHLGKKKRPRQKAPDALLSVRPLELNSAPPNVSNLSRPVGGRRQHLPLRHNHALYFERDEGGSAWLGVAVHRSSIIHFHTLGSTLLNYDNSLKTLN